MVQVVAVLAADVPHRTCRLEAVTVVEPEVQPSE
jgi:hypothetical protein